jgi:hypothetical protein
VDGSPAATGAVYFRGRTSRVSTPSRHASRCVVAISPPRSRTLAIRPRRRAASSVGSYERQPRAGRSTPKPEIPGAADTPRARLSASATLSSDCEPRDRLARATGSKDREIKPNVARNESQRTACRKVICCPKRHRRMPFCRVYKRMMGLEPTTFCMASASDVRACSQPCAQTACFQGFRSGERTRANPSERRTLPFLPRPVRRPRHHFGAGGHRGPSALDVLGAIVDVHARVSIRRRL